MGFGCAVVDGSVTSERFMIKSGVQQGCVMSGILFLLCLDWVMRKAKADKRRGKGGISQQSTTVYATSLCTFVRFETMV